MSNGGNGSTPISPKVTGASIGGAVATLVWTLLVVLFDPVRERMGEGALTAVTGATGTILSVRVRLLHKGSTAIGSRGWTPPVSSPPHWDPISGRLPPGCRE
jgi:hypothetical protein